MSIRRHAAWSAGAAIVLTTSRFALLVVLGRRLGPHALGRFVYTMRGGPRFLRGFVRRRSCAGAPAVVAWALVLATVGTGDMTDIGAAASELIAAVHYAGRFGGSGVGNFVDSYSAQYAPAR